jgi:hypothetical protein
MLSVICGIQCVIIKGNNDSGGIPLFISILLAIALGCVFLAMGGGIYKIVGPRSETLLKTEMIRLTGVAAAFGFSALAFELNLSTIFLFSTLTALVIFGLPYIDINVSKITAQSTKTFFRLRATAWVSGIFYAIVMQGSFTNVWKFRTGPDAFGWSDAALAICRGDTRASLSERVISQLQGTGLIASFQRPVKLGETSIAQSPSFTDQACTP